MFLCAFLNETQTYWTSAQAGIFSAVVTAFIIEGYKSLRPDPADVSAVLLKAILLQLSNGSLTDIPTIEDISLRTDSSAIRIAILWFLSLVLSLSSALASTLLKQWARNFERVANGKNLEPKARYYSRLYRGSMRVQSLSTLVHTVQNLLHISVFLFLGGLFEFLQPINILVSYVTLGTVSLTARLYLTATFTGLFNRGSPYQTPLSAFVRRVGGASLGNSPDSPDQTPLPVQIGRAINAAAALRNFIRDNRQ